MAAFELVHPDSRDIYTQLAYITHELRFYEKKFVRDPYDSEAELMVIKFQTHADDWLLDNLKKVQKAAK